MDQYMGEGSTFNTSVFVRGLCQGSPANKSTVASQIFRVLNRTAFGAPLGAMMVPSKPIKA
jgi:hypothetical protein